MASSTAWGAAINSALADGDWHSIEDVVSLAAAAVPPGVAYRRAELNRERSRAKRERHSHPIGTRQSGVEAGAHDIAYRTLASRISRGQVERDGELVRRRP